MEEVDLQTALALLSLPRTLGDHPESQEPIVAHNGRYGPYVKCGTETRSLPDDMTPMEVTLEQALVLLAQPKARGRSSVSKEPIKVFEASPVTDQPVKLLNGRYGPYIQRGDERRSLESEEQLFTLTVEEALKYLAEPPRRRGQSRSGPLRELGKDPVSGKEVTVRSGRYGPYVTDGEVNASLRKGDSPESITIERAADLLAARRERLGQ